MKPELSPAMEEKTLQAALEVQKKDWGAGGMAAVELMNILRALVLAAQEERDKEWLAMIKLTTIPGHKDTIPLAVECLRDREKCAREAAIEETARRCAEALEAKAASFHRNANATAAACGGEPESIKCCEALDMDAAVLILGAELIRKEFLSDAE